MNVESIIVGPFEVNCYLAKDAASRLAVVVDPGADAEAVADRLRRAELTVACYLLTHGHVDHVSALAELADEFPAPAVMHPADARWAFESANRLEPYYAAPRRPSAAVVFPENLRLTAGPWECRIITLRPSPGGVCYHFPEQNVIFTGDTLSRGRWAAPICPGATPGPWRIPAAFARFAGGDRMYRDMAQLPPWRRNMTPIRSCRVDAGAEQCAGL